MKNYLMKLSFFVLILAVSIRVDVQAAEIKKPATSGKGVSVLRCIEKGGQDYKLFLDASIYNDDLAEGIIEPWNDILKRNQCQSSDVLSLVKQQDSIRSAIRDAFLTCNTEKLPKLKKSFHELTAEIYYVRHVVDGGIVLSLPFDLLTARPFEKAAEADSEQLYAQMREKYLSEEMIGEGDFEELFQRLVEKYLDKKKTYVAECSTNTWQDVADKWHEFISTVGGIEPAFSEMGKGLEKRANEVADEASSLKIVEVLKGDKSVGDYLGSFATITVNNLDPRKALEDIGNALYEDLPLTEVSENTAPSQQQILDSLATHEAEYDISKTRESLKSEFTTLYYNASNESIELFLNSLDGRGTKNIVDDGLIDIINVSLPEMAKIVNGVDKINDRQCPG